MKKRILKILLWLFVLVAFIAGTSFVIHFYNNNTCKNIRIHILCPKGSEFLSENDIMKYLGEYSDSLVGMKLSDIDIEKIEQILTKKPYVEQAKVYTTIHGDFYVEILQRVPIVRVQNIYDSSYYISDDGTMLPLVSNKTTRIICANGNIKNLYFDGVNVNFDSTYLSNDSLNMFTPIYRVYKVAKYINTDEFLKAQIQQIYIDGKNNIHLIPTIGNHIIQLGDDNNLDEKFKKLKIFYKKAVFIDGWDKYDTINVKYKNQIVCS